MRTNIWYLLSAVGLILFLAGCVIQDAPLGGNAVLVTLELQHEGSSPLAVLSDALEKEDYALDWARAESGAQGGLTVTVLPLAEVAGQVVITERGGRIEMAQLALFMEDGQPLKDWPVCHRPPGNPANAHTIYVDYPAVSTHLTKHDDALGFCVDAANGARASSTYVVLTPGNPPMTGKATYDEQGNAVVEEAGESVGTATLEALTTVKPLPPVEEPDTGLAEFAEFLRETLGDEADPFLEAIPTSMGGTGPELLQLTPQQAVEICSASTGGALRPLQCGGSMMSGRGSNIPPEVPTGTPAEEATLGAAAGTLNYSDRVGSSFMFVFNLDAPPPAEGFEVSIFGPRGWNGGDPARRVYRYGEAGRHATWVNVFRDNDGNNMEAVSGPYIVQADINGEAQRVEVTVDTSKLLPKPTLALLGQNASSVSVSWEAVPGAASYLVELFETDTGTLSENVYLYTTDLSATLEGLNLTVGGEYRVGVTALSVDFTENASKNLPQGPFNTSFSSQRFTVATE